MKQNHLIIGSILTACSIILFSMSSVVSINATQQNGIDETSDSVVDSAKEPTSKNIDTLQVTITESNDTNPPIVEIHKPKNALYIKDNEIMPFFVPLIISDIQIWPYAYDNESNIIRLDLFIDDELMDSFPGVPYSWTWDIVSFGKRTIKLVAYDASNNSADIELDVWKFL